MGIAFRYLLVGGVVGVFVLNVLMGGYLFLQLLHSLGRKRSVRTWAGWWVAASLLFGMGCVGIFHGGILLLAGNLLLLGYTIFRQSQARAQRETVGQSAVTGDVWPPPPTGPTGTA